MQDKINQNKFPDNNNDDKNLKTRMMDIHKRLEQITEFMSMHTSETNYSETRSASQEERQPSHLTNRSSVDRHNQSDSIRGHNEPKEPNPIKDCSGQLMTPTKTTRLKGQGYKYPKPEEKAEISERRSHDPSLRVCRTNYTLVKTHY